MGPPTRSLGLAPGPIRVPTRRGGVGSTGKSSAPRSAGRRASGSEAPGASGALALYPGMAAAFPGMGRALADNPAAKRVLAEFSGASGEDISRLVLEAGESELHSDRAWELAVVATEVAAFEAFCAEGRVVSGALGFSIGAYAALLGAGMFKVHQVVTMIDIVLEASRRLPGRYAMVAITGPSIDEVGELCRSGAVEVSSVLGQGPVIVAGDLAATERLVEKISPFALRVTHLPVRWPLHTTLMEPVATALDRGRRSVGRLRPLRHPVYSGLDGSRLTTPSEAWNLLVQHLVRPQRFDLALPAALADGFGRMVELGPGTTLARAGRGLGGPSLTVESFPVSERGPVRGAGQRC